MDGNRCALVQRLIGAEITKIGGIVENRLIMRCGYLGRIDKRCLWKSVMLKVKSRAIIASQRAKKRRSKKAEYIRREKLARSGVHESFNL